jgi:integrase
MIDGTAARPPSQRRRRPIGALSEPQKWPISRTFCPRAPTDGFRLGTVTASSANQWEREHDRPCGRLGPIRDLGAHRVSDVRHQDLQALVDRLVAAKLSGSRVRNVIVPVQAFYRHAKKRGLVDFDPSDDLELPESDGSTEWDGTPDDVRALLDPLDEDDEALCATAAYGGLRTGELRALRVSNVHGLDGGECWIEVEHGWDPIEGEILPKSKAGVRAALMPDTLAGDPCRARPADRQDR